MPDQTDNSTAPTSLESLAFSSAPKLAKDVRQASGIWALLFVLQGLAVMAALGYGGIYLIPGHIDRINAGQAAIATADRDAREKSWAEYKSAIKEERETYRQGLETLGQRIDRGFDRLRDRNGANAKFEVDHVAKGVAPE